MQVLCVLKLFDKKLLQHFLELFFYKKISIFQVINFFDFTTWLDFFLNSLGVPCFFDVPAWSS